jgi:hypothetical protein
MEKVSKHADRATVRMGLRVTRRLRSVDRKLASGIAEYGPRLARRMISNRAKQRLIGKMLLKGVAETVL